MSLSSIKSSTVLLIAEGGASLENNVGLPRIPKMNKPVEVVQPPEAKIKKNPGLDSYEHSWQLFIYLIARGIRQLPQILMMVVLPLVVLTVVNIILESIPTYSLYGPGKVVVLTLVFLTSSYNSAVPRAIYWVIMFTLGRSLFIRVRNEGFSKVVGDFRQFPTQLKASRDHLGKLSNARLLIGGGIGFYMANFLSRNNRIDKVLVCYVLALALVNGLSKGSKGLLFVAIKLVVKDLTAWIKSLPEMSTETIYMVVSGVVFGLVGNTIFAVIKLGSGGYILGTILAVAGCVLLIIDKKEVNEN